VLCLASLPPGQMPAKGGGRKVKGKVETYVGQGTERILKQKGEGVEMPAQGSHRLSSTSLLRGGSPWVQENGGG